jgi:ATP-dependent DNA ligase
MFKNACGVGLEAVVSQVRDSAYHSGRRNDWVKKNLAQRDAADRRFRPAGEQVRPYLSRPA